MKRSILLVALTLAGLTACHAGADHSVETPSAERAKRAPVVEVLTLESKALSRTVEVSGTAQAIEAAGLASPAGGITTAILVEVGDTVRKGQALVKYRNERVTTGRMQAANSALAAETQAAFAEAELKRLRPLAERGTIAPTQIEQLETQAKAARAQAQAAKSAERSAAAVEEDLTLRAPFDGVVTSVRAQLGETATGAPAVRVADLSKLELEVAVHERDLARVHPGGTAEVRFPNFGVSATGTIDWVSMEIDRHTRSAAVVATLDNRELQIPSGAFAEAKLVADRDRKGLVAPRAAIGTDGDASFVWLIQEQTANRQPVEVRPLDDGLVEIVAGLQPGQTIVANRVSAVSAGPVQLRGGER